MWLSDDNVLFENVGVETNSHAGGTLLDALPDTALSLIDQGPTFTIAGPDISNVVDLTGDLERWRQGGQTVFIGGEMMFVRKITILGPTTARLDGLLRARYSTRRQTHPVGTPLFIVVGAEITPAENTMTSPIGATLYGKSQPFIGTSELPLEDILSDDLVLNGWGDAPVPVSGLAVDAPHFGVPGFETGDDMTFEWAYSTPRTQDTGAGWTPAGNAIVPPPAEGQFELLVYEEPAHTLVRTELLTAPTFTYTAATRTGDMGGDSDFSIEVRQIRAGVYSAVRSLEISFIV
jgi:hypothetical protein